MRIRSGRGWWVAGAVLAAVGLAGEGRAADWSDVTQRFRAHYESRLGPVEVARSPVPGGGEQIALVSPKLKGEGNQPLLLVHPERRDDVVVLFHGLTDSPYYMRAIADEFFAAGANVVLPLLPAHGLVDPDAAMEDGELAQKWKAVAGDSVGVAMLLGDRISLGGLSTGGALSVYQALSDPERVRGGLFLFSAALSVGTLNELAGSTVLLVPAIAKAQDGEYLGVGPNPYKYPHFTQFGGLQLSKLITEINELLEQAGPKQRIFAVHSIHDDSALPKGVGQLLRSEGAQGVAIVVASNPPIEHASVVLAEDIVLDQALVPEGETPPIPRANPSYRSMMELALTFLRRLP